MKYTMSMTSDREHLKDLIMSDSKMSDTEKLHDVAILDKEKKPDASSYFAEEV